MKVWARVAKLRKELTEALKEAGKEQKRPDLFGTLSRWYCAATEEELVAIAAEVAEWPDDPEVEWGEHYREGVSTSKDLFVGLLEAATVKVGDRFFTVEDQWSDAQKEPLYVTTVDADGVTFRTCTGGTVRVTADELDRSYRRHHADPYGPKPAAAGSEPESN